MIKTKREFLKSSKNIIITSVITSILPGFIRCGITEPGQGSYYVIAEKCTGCGDCVSVCRRNAITLINDKAEIDKSRCSDCGDCQRVCKDNAIDH